MDSLSADSTFDLSFKSENLSFFAPVFASYFYTILCLFMLTKFKNKIMALRLEHLNIWSPASYSVRVTGKYLFFFV